MSNRRTYRNINVVVNSVNEITVTKGETEFLLQLAVDGTWGVDFYAPRVDMKSTDYLNMRHYIRVNNSKVEFDYYKDEDGEGSQMWITGELYTVLHMMTLACVKEEWSQYYKGDK